MREVEIINRRHPMKKPTIRIFKVFMVLLPLTLASLLFASDQPDKIHTGIANGLASGKLIGIGTISAENPTVSSLLIQNAALKNNFWDIIYAEPNKKKDFIHIRPGTEIYYNQETKELLWASSVSNPAPVAVMPETIFEFPPVIEGETARHDFLIQNRGDADLAVVKVRTT